MYLRIAENGESNSLKISIMFWYLRANSFAALVSLLHVDVRNDFFSIGFEMFSRIIFLNSGSGTVLNSIVSQ